MWRRDCDTLTVQDPNELDPHPSDVILYYLGLCRRNVWLEFRERGLRLRTDESCFNFRQQLVGVLATRQEMQTL